MQKKIRDVMEMTKTRKNECFRGVKAKSNPQLAGTKTVEKQLELNQSDPD
jgi:hypothetical protein